MEKCDWRETRPEWPRTKSIEDVLELHLEPLGVPVLYKLPLLTYHAYNQVAQNGSWCLYSVPAPERLPAQVPPSVSLRRPGGGAG